MSVALITIRGSALRANARSGRLEHPVISVRDATSERTGFGATFTDPVRVVYLADPTDPASCGADSWIEASGAVELSPAPLLPMRCGGIFVHTNTKIAHANRAALTAGVCVPMAPALAVRVGAKSAPAVRCAEALTTGPSWLIYAAPGGPVAPMGCGARIWLLTFDPVTVLERRQVPQQTRLALPA